MRVVSTMYMSGREKELVSLPAQSIADMNARYVRSSAKPSRNIWSGFTGRAAMPISITRPIDALVNASLSAAPIST